MQPVHHFFLGTDNGLPPIFYELLEDIAEGTHDPARHSLRATLRLLHHVLCELEGLVTRELTSFAGQRA